MKSEQDVARQNADQTPTGQRTRGYRTSLQRETQPGFDIRLEVEVGLRAEADPDLLQRAMGSLLRNAVSYAGTAGPITVSGAVTTTRFSSA